MGSEWLYEKYSKEFMELDRDFIQPPSSNTTKRSYLISFGNYYLKPDNEYSDKALYAIFWRALNDSKKAIQYLKDKEQRKQLVEDKKSTIKQLSSVNNNIKSKNRSSIPEQLKLF